MARGDDMLRDAWHKGQHVRLKTDDWVGALTRNDPDWSARPPEKPWPKREVDHDRVKWEEKRRRER